MDVIIIKIPRRDKIILGAGMHQRELFEEAEQVMKKELISYEEESVRGLNKLQLQKSLQPALQWNSEMTAR